MASYRLEMTIQCAKCGVEIPAERVQAVPGTVLCTACTAASGDVPRVLGINVYEHKTAGAIEVVTPAAFFETNRLDPRPARPKKALITDDSTKCTRLPGDASCVLIVEEMQTVRGSELDAFEKSFLRHSIGRNEFSSKQKQVCRRLAEKFDLRSWKP